MSEIKIKYGDGVIEFCERDETWNVSIGNNIIARRSSLKEAKKALDTHGEEEKKFKRHTALFKPYSGKSFEKVTVTSYPAGTNYRSDPVWVTFANKRRATLSCTDLKEDNDENARLVGKLACVNDAMEALRKEERALLDKMTDYKKRTA